MFESLLLSRVVCLYEPAPQTIKQPVLPVRSAAEYQLPNSFLQTMQKPLPERQNSVLADLWAFN